MGTQYTISIISTELINNAEAQTELSTLITEKLEDIENSFSTYRADSELMLLNNAALNTWHNVSEDLFTVLELSQRISELSEGAFDITVAPLVNLWGFGPDYRILETIPAEQEIQTILNTIGYQHLLLNPELQMVQKQQALSLDLSAIAKGYGVDLIAELLSQQGFTNFIVEIGGEVKTAGKNLQDQDWKIAIESPTEAGDVAMILPLSNLAMATSGDYRNYYSLDGSNYSHTISPRTGRPVEHNLSSATVISPSTAEADAFATAFMVLGSQAALIVANRLNIPAYFISSIDGELVETYSESFGVYIE